MAARCETVETVHTNFLVVVVKWSEFWKLKPGPPDNVVILHLLLFAPLLSGIRNALAACMV